MKAPKIIGLVLFGGGALVLIVYGLYEATQELWSDPEVPLAIKIGFVALLLGFLLLIGVLIAERTKDSKKEKPYDNDHNL